MVVTIHVSRAEPCRRSCTVLKLGPEEEQGGTEETQPRARIARIIRKYKVAGGRRKEVGTEWPALYGLIIATG